MPTPDDPKDPSTLPASEHPEPKSLLDKVTDILTRHHKKVLDEEKTFLDARWSDTTERHLADELIKHGDGFSEHDDPSSKAE